MDPLTTEKGCSPSFSSLPGAPGFTDGETEAQGAATVHQAPGPPAEPQPGDPAQGLEPRTDSGVASLPAIVSFGPPSLPDLRPGRAAAQAPLGSPRPRSRPGRSGGRRWLRSVPHLRPDTARRADRSADQSRPSVSRGRPISALSPPREAGLEATGTSWTAEARPRSCCRLRPLPRRGHAPAAPWTGLGHV